MCRNRTSVRTRYHIPTRFNWQNELSAVETTRLESAITAAIQRAVEGSANAASAIVSGNSENSEALAELFSSQRYRPGRDTYAIPSYDDGGRPQEVPIENATDLKQTEASQQPTWDKKTVLAYLQRTFGTYTPRGRTYYGVQTPNGIEVADVRGSLSVYTFERTSKKEGKWVGTSTVKYPPGRYTFTVTGKAEGDYPHPNVGIVTDFQGQKFGDPVYSLDTAGFQIVFHVPAAESIKPASTEESGTVQPNDGSRGSSAGVGIMHRGAGTQIVYWKCGGNWNTNFLVDPAYAGASDDDYWTGFLMLCHARAVDNLNISDKYIREVLVQRFLGPGGSTNTLSASSRKNVLQFQEDVKILRGLLVTSTKLNKEINALQSRIASLTRKHYRRGRFELYPSTYVGPSPADLPIWQWLTAQMEDRLESKKAITTAILKLVQQDPFLTQFISRLKISDGSVSDDTPTTPTAALNDALEEKVWNEMTAEQVQKVILERLNDILGSIARAHHKLCDNRERILDVPLVYEAVQKLVYGLNPRFDEVVKERIAEHHREEAWIDIGLSALGLALFVGGLIVSLAGGPGGVILFLELSGTVLGAITAARSFGKADFLSAAADAAVLKGSGLVSLDVAREAVFWAKVDAVLLAVDGGIQAIRLARAALQGRNAAALSNLAKGAEKLTEAEEAARLVPFDELVKKATPRGKLPLSDAELTQLQSLGNKFPDFKVAGQIAEEAAARVVSASGDYVQLPTIFRQGNLNNVGIDLLYVRRSIFESAFGSLANPRDAGKLLEKATEQQRQRFFEALRKSANTEDLISIEVKFSRAGYPIEELLREGRKSVQQKTGWYVDLMKNMLKAKDPEVVATGRLLQEIIGSGAQDLGRLSRIGVVMDVNGVFTLQKLSDKLIDLGHPIYLIFHKGKQGPYLLLGEKLLAAERAGKPTANLRAKMVHLNTQIDALDLAVKQAKQADLASERALAAVQKANESLAEVAVLSAQPKTPAVLSALHTATAAARLYLQVVKYSSEEADADYQRAGKIIKETKDKYPEFDASIKALLAE